MRKVAWIVCVVIMMGTQGLRADVISDREKELQTWLESHGGGALRQGDMPFKEDPSKPISWVSLSHGRATDADVATLVTMLRGLDSVKAVVLPHAATDLSLKEIVTLKSLEQLYAGESQITDEGMKFLVEAKGLRRLSLERSAITDKGVENFKDVAWLEGLDLDNTPVTDACLAYLKGMTNLKVLWLSHTNITDAHLGSIGKLPELEDLALNDTQVTNSGMIKLRNLKKLKTLGVAHTRVTPRGEAVINKFLPDVKVEGASPRCEPYPTSVPSR